MQSLFTFLEFHLLLKRAGLMLVSFKKEPTPMEQAVAAHQQGKLAVAEGLYRQILARNANDPEANHMLGLLLHQAGHSAQGVTLIERSLAAPDAAKRRRTAIWPK